MVTLQSPFQFITLLVTIGLLLWISPSNATDICDFAEILGKPLYATVSEAHRDTSDARMALNTEIARQRLLSAKFTDAKVSKHARDAMVHLEECRHQMEVMRKLDTSMPDVEGLASHSLKVAPLLGTDPKTRTTQQNADIAQFAAKVLIELGKMALEADAKREARFAYSKALRNAEYELILASIGSGRATSIPASPGLLRIDVDSSWNSYYDGDMIYLKNTSGATLHDCTLYVSTSDATDKKGGATHVHFVKTWNPGVELIAKYPSDSVKTLGNWGSVKILEGVEVALVSQEKSGLVKFKYLGAPYDEDVARYFKAKLPKFHLWYTEKNLFYDAGVNVYHYNGIKSFPVDNVLITFISGNLEKSVSFSGFDGRWSAGDSYSPEMLRSPKFNDLKPKKVKMTVRFPYSSFQYALEYNVK